MDVNVVQKFKKIGHGQKSSVHLFFGTLVPQNLHYQLSLMVSRKNHLTVEGRQNLLNLLLQHFKDGELSRGAVTVASRQFQIHKGNGSNYITTHQMGHMVCPIFLLELRKKPKYQPWYCILAWICIYRIYISMKPIKFLICLFNGSHVATVRKVANNTGHGTIQVEVWSCNQYGTEVVVKIGLYIHGLPQNQKL